MQSRQHNNHYANKINIQLFSLDICKLYMYMVTCVITSEAKSFFLSPFSDSVRNKLYILIDT